MTIAHTKLPGLDEGKLVALVEPVLAKHRVDGVELIWRSDKEGQLLLLTIEKPETTRTGEGITVDLCSAISREVSELFDESGLIVAHYRLEVGSPGVERKLYLIDDYRRFAGQEIKVSLKEPLEEEGFIGKGTLRGTLFGLDEEGMISLQTDHGNLVLSLKSISSARLVFSWNQSRRSARRPRRPADKGSKAQINKGSIENGRG